MSATAASLAPRPAPGAALVRRPRPRRTATRSASRSPSRGAGARPDSSELPLPAAPLDDALWAPPFECPAAAAVCPVTRAPLTGADVGRSDADFAFGGLTRISARAARARQGRTVADALRLARLAAASPDRQAHGMDAHAWMRLALLISFTTPLPHDEAARLPLRLLPPARLRLINPVQALQTMLALQVTRAGHPRRCAALADEMPSPEARYAFNSLMLTLLARRIAAGRLTDPLAERHAVEDVWRDPVVQRRWERLAQSLSAADCERLCELAARRRWAWSHSGRSTETAPNHAATLQFGA